MNRVYLALTVTAIAAFLLVGCDRAPTEVKQSAPVPAATKVATAGGPQTTCPVMDGSPINKNLFVDHEGKRIYFCCGGCDVAFKKDPAKYMQKLAAQGVVLENAPAGGLQKPSGDGG